MNTEHYNQLKQLVIQKLLSEKEKEYYCHIRFVRDIGVKLATSHDVNRQLIEIACLLHDIGRDYEQEGEDHGDAGARIAKEFPLSFVFTPSEQGKIITCIKNHNKILPTYSLEEKIVITADAASKVLYHAAFMLLCKKQTYAEKLAWGYKYLEKGYHNIHLPDYKKYLTPHYTRIKEIYDAVSVQEPL